VQDRKIRDKEGPTTSKTKQHDWKMRDQIPRVKKCRTNKCKTENVRLENGGPKMRGGK